VLVGYKFKSDLARILHNFPQARHLDKDPQTIRDWNLGRIPMLVAHAKSAGHGLNLQWGGRQIAFFGIDWSWEEHSQLLERLGPTRQAQIGRKLPVLIHYILARDTVDEEKLLRVHEKASVEQTLMNFLKRRKAA
jgi:SNF2 family DNA or RNA helicase